MKKPKRIRVSVDLELDVHARLQVLARQHDRSLRAQIANLAREAVTRIELPKPAPGPGITAAQWNAPVAGQKRPTDGGFAPSDQADLDDKKEHEQLLQDEFNDLLNDGTETMTQIFERIDSMWAGYGYADLWRPLQSLTPEQLNLHRARCAMQGRDADEEVMVFARREQYL